MDEIDLTTIPDEFKELLRTKLKKQDDATYNKALSLFRCNLLGFDRVMKAALGSIDIDEIEETQRKADATMPTAGLSTKKNENTTQG